MVEHRLPKPGVAGSIPVSRSKCNNKIESRSADSKIALRLSIL
jgi:hypothetical protein